MEEVLLFEWSVIRKKFIQVSASEANGETEAFFSAESASEHRTQRWASWKARKAASLTQTCKFATCKCAYQTNRQAAFSRHADSSASRTETNPVSQFCCLQSAVLYTYHESLVPNTRNVRISKRRKRAWLSKNRTRVFSAFRFAAFSLN